MTGATPLSFAASPSRNSRDKAAFPHARPLTTPGRAIPSAIPHNLLPSAPASPPTPAPSPTPHQRAPSWSNAGENEDAFLKDARAHFSGLGGPERQRFLAELLNLCNSQLLSFVHSFVSPRLKRDPFQALPTELCLRVLAFIDDPKTLARASQVSRRWHELLADDMTWKNLCDKHAYRRLSQESSMHHGRSRSSAPGRPSPYIHIPRSASYDPSWTGPSSSTPDLPSHSLDDTNTAKSAISKIRPISYKSHFKQRYMVETAWRSGGTAVSRHITPDQGVVTSLHLTDKYIVAALDNAKIHVFDTDGNNQKTLQGHVMGVWAMVPWDDILVSGGCDRDVRVWNMATGQSIHTLRGHTSTVRCLKMSDANTAISGSRDTTLRIWDLVNGVCKNVLIGHQASVRCLEINGDLVVSGSYDTTARIWSISGGRCLRVLTGHFSQIYAIAFDGKRIVTGSLDTSVRVWDPASGQCQAILQGHTSLVGQLQMRGDTLVTGGSDGSVRIWSLRKMAPIHRLAAHDNSVTSLQFDDARVVSGGSDGRVKVWDMETGHLVRELGTPAEQVWRVAFEEEKAVIMGSRQQRTVMEVWSFSPPEEVVQEDRSSRSPVSAPEQTMPDYVGEPMAEQVEASTTAPTDLTMDDAMEGAIDP
ncbi:WD40 repeat-like protein [Xylona heveae TC161]|uniref:WD40 repeat-like protein n=1 Tax=Xylona heveae (strain CBS 132557 / TC161) TaxID=1328760 RepID=A0A165G1S7_XYLHT|nr:WD40 repeat-like protein [Xylona heveae TC161]KZF21640.1 WD40 repeat-like protein [Xylona heveae TC161]